MAQHDRRLKFYRAAAVPCPYLPDRLEEKILTFLPDISLGDPYAMLGTLGFRRNHDVAYVPDCSGCRACQPVRVHPATFKPSRTQRRILRRNAGLQLALVPAQATEEQFVLFQRYQQARHAGGGMSDMHQADYAEMVAGGHANTALYEWRDEAGTLQAVMLVDRLNDGVSAVSSFFDPDQPQRSLGTFMILSLIESARARNDYVYLGFYVAGSEKMAYKANFQPLEVLGHDGWQII